MLKVIHPADITGTSRTFTCTQGRGHDGEALLVPHKLTAQSDDGVVRITMGDAQVVLVGEQCRELALMFCEAAGMEAVSRR